MGEFTSLGLTSLVETIGSFDRNTYSVNIDNRILPFVCDVHDGPASFILQEDSCRPHRAKTIAMYMANEKITRMKWTARAKVRFKSSRYCIGNIQKLI